MLTLPKINPGDYEETLALLLDEAEKLSKSGSGWQSFGESSPCTAVIELLTFIALTQRENMNTINARVLFNLGKLFGREPRLVRPARALAAVNGEGLLKKGERFHIDDFSFEAEHETALNTNKLSFVGEVKDGKLYRINYNPEAMSVRLFESADNIVFGFTEPFDVENEIALTLSLEEFGRHGLSELNESNFVCGSKLSIDYYGTENGVKGWHKADFSDETLALLRSGTIRLKVHGVLDALNSMYIIRISAVEKRFDRLPVVRGVYTSVASLLQTETLCRTIDFSVESFRDNKMYFTAAVPDDAAAELYILTRNGYVNANDVGVNYKIKDSKGDDRLLTSSRKRIATVLLAGVSENEDAVLRLAIYEKQFVRDVLKFSADGSASQSFGIGFAGTVAESVRVMVSDARGYYTEWSYKDSLNGINGFDKSFTVSENKINFGDNINGAAPLGKIHLIGLSLSAGERGNLPVGKLTSGSGLSAQLILPASGGTDEEGAAEFYLRVIGEKESGTILTENDFCERALMTPGLLLRDAHAFSESDGVSVVIDPDIPDFEGNQALYQYYLTNISRYMATYKPLGLKLNVIFPIYIGVDVHAEISGSLDTKELEAAVKSEAESFFANLSGTSAEYSELHARIMKLSGVIAIHGLSIDAESVHARRTSDGGLEFPSFVRLKLKQCVVNISRDY